jgi:hypothetical protein
MPIRLWERRFPMEKRMSVKAPEWANWWWRVAYLMPVPYAHLHDIIEIRPDEKFQAYVEDLVRAGMNGQKIPEAVAPAVYNMVDDVLAGRPITLRTGDYIALQSYRRAQG